MERDITLLAAAIILVSAVWFGLGKHKEKTCPRCGGTMDWNDGYGKWYCRSCGETVR